MEKDFTGKAVLIVLNWNGKSDTLALLATVKNTPVIVVDNGSTDGSPDVILTTFPSVTLLRNKENLGFSAGNNVGIRYAMDHGAKVIILLNNDTLINDRTVLELTEALEKDEKAGAAGSKIYFRKDGEEVLWYAGGIIDWNNMYGSHRGVDAKDTGQYDEMEETDFITGCCFAVKREVVERVGMLDEKYYLYYEDADWSLRIRKAGYKLLYVPTSTLFHVNASSSGGPGSKLHCYYQTRNRYLIGMKFAPWRTKLALLRECVRNLFVSEGPERQGTRDFLLGRFGKGSFHV